MANNATDPYHYPDTDWADLLLKNTTSHQQHNFNVSGGTDKLQSKFSFNYQTADGYYANKSYERYAGRVNNDYKIKFLDPGANIDIDFSTSKSVSPANHQSCLLGLSDCPYYNPYWEDGRYADEIRSQPCWLCSMKEERTRIIIINSVERPNWI